MTLREYVIASQSIITVCNAKTFLIRIQRSTSSKLQKVYTKTFYMSSIRRRIFQSIILLLTLRVMLVAWNSGYLYFLKKKKEKKNNRELKDERLYIFLSYRATFCIPRLRHKSSYALTDGSPLSRSITFEPFSFRMERETSDKFRHDGACIQ